MTVAQINKLRRTCFEQSIEFRVVKNTLIKKAFERMDNPAKYDKIAESLKGSTAIMFSELSNTPAKLLKEFRKKNDLAMPLLKAAYIDSDVFFGDDQLDTLIKLKSKFELLGELLGLLQSPIANVLGALQSGGNTLGGLIKTLEEREAA